MTTTNHALTGAMIGTILGNPFLAIPLAFLSHFVCDALPHFGINDKNFFGSKAMYYWLSIDGLLAVCFAAILLIVGVNNPLLLAVCGFVAMSPDLAWLYYGLRGRPNKLHKHDYLNRFHAFIQWYQKPPGLVVEIIWAGLMVFVILKLQ